LTQLDLLAKYSKSVTEGQEKYEKLINDQSLDINKRRITILSMIDNILRESSVTLSMATQPKIAFPINTKQIQNFF